MMWLKRFRRPFRIEAVRATSWVIALAAACLSPAQAQTPSGFTFALIGDLGYYPIHEPWVDAVHADINRDAGLAFVVHVGDLSRPVHACTQETLDRRRAQFDGSAHPLIFTPGDNDWADCHDKQGVKGGDPLAALARLRTMFFPDDESLGRRKIRLTRQSQAPEFAKFRENARWDVGGVTFVTLHVTGSNNNHGRTPEADAEYEERNKANLAWLRQAFAHAAANNSRAVMVVQQANIFPDITPFPGSARSGQRVERRPRRVAEGDAGVRQAGGAGAWRQPLLPHRQRFRNAPATGTAGGARAVELHQGRDLRDAEP